MDWYDRCMNREKEACHCKNITYGMIRKRFQFHGCVQGVGFRFTALHAANRLNLTGWVRNEYDGSVTLEAQGREEELDMLVQMIRDGRYIEIDRIDVTEQPVVLDEKSFQVRH